MLYEVMSHIRNFFVYKRTSGKFTIENGNLKDVELNNGDYILIVGSHYNNGVHKIPHTFKNEVFDGDVDILCPPDEFISLVGEIESFCEQTKQKMSPFQSESFGGYSYTRAMNSNGTFASWQDVYRNRLNTWRKI